MRNKILLGVIFSGIVAMAIAFTLPSPAAAADDVAKNLKVLPKTMPKPEIKKLMKAQAAALGVQCDHCHNTDDFAEDSEKKETARKMMLMSEKINKENFGGKTVVGCITCHNGQKEPKTLAKP
jgi:hypothetical protein